MEREEAKLAPVAWWHADRALRRTFVNETDANEWAGAMVADQGAGWRDVVHPDDLPRYERELRGIAGTDRTLTLDYRVLAPSGRVAHIREELTGHVDGQTAVSGICVDVSDVMTNLERERERRRDLEALDEFVQRLGRTTTTEELVTVVAEHGEEAIGTLNIALLLVSPTRKELSVYQGPHPAMGTTALRIVEFTGDTPAGLAAMTGEEAFYTDAEQVSEAFPRLAERMADDRILGAAALPLISDSETFGALWLRWDRAVDFDEHLVDSLRRTARALTDAVVRNRAAAENQDRREELTQSNRELESISAVAAHDLKAPLRRVHSYVQLIERELKSVPVSNSAARYAEVIRSQIDDMNQLIDDILDYSAANRPNLEFVALDLSDVIDDVETTLQPLAEARGAVIQRGSLPKIRGNRGLLNQVFGNLIGNAIKYADPDRDPIVEIEAVLESDDERDPLWRIAVSDNGIGIAEELQPRIFQMFERAVSDESSGTGIGLAIVKRITERHGGTVWVQSVPGAGSTFHLTLRGVPITQVV